jgi:hypothetical protein
MTKLDQLFVWHNRIQDTSPTTSDMEFLKLDFYLSLGSHNKTLPLK